MKRHVVPALGWVLLAGLFAAWALLLRPATLGGDATYVLVRGDSMLPVYQSGDLVIVRREPPYGVGDIVAFRVPADEVGEGQVVLHRLVEGVDGTFTAQGDNNPARDPWAADNEQILGRAWLAIPGAGRAVVFLTKPMVAACLAMAIVMALVLLRPSQATNRQRKVGHPRRRLPTRAAG